MTGGRACSRSTSWLARTAPRNRSRGARLSDRLAREVGDSNTQILGLEGETLRVNACSAQVRNASDASCHCTAGFLRASRYRIVW